METQFIGVDWADFCGALRSGTVVQPFLVLELGPGEKPSWFLYGVSAGMLVQVMTFRKSRRSWRRVDGVIKELQREFEVLPALKLFGSADSVELEDLKSG